MLDQDTRAAILKLRENGRGYSPIARLLGVSKNTVKKVVASGQAEAPDLMRARILDAYLDEIRLLHAECKGNEVRVHEELVERFGLQVGYSTVTDFCRVHEIGHEPPVPVGRYEFAPGVEMQHDTSPHKVRVGGRMVTLQCASLILKYSRKQYAQCYQSWSRLEARHFHTEAIRWLGGSAARNMIDNSSVIIAHGNGKDAVAAPACQALADRHGFYFEAHELGDVNRSANVERDFDTIEKNFYPGRTFADLEDLNRQLVTWCEKRFVRHRRSLQASPRDLFATELAHLQPVPEWTPEIYELHRRRVDVEGYVRLDTNRYSVDARYINQHVELREHVDKIRIFSGHTLVNVHPVKHLPRAHKRVTLPEHRGRARRLRKERPQPPEEKVLRAQGAPFDELIDQLQKRHGGRSTRAVRQLHRLWRDYPQGSVAASISEALRYGLTDPRRIEAMVLRRIAGDIFTLPTDREDDPHER